MKRDTAIIGRYFSIIDIAEKMILTGMHSSDPAVRSAYRKAMKIYKKMTNEEVREVKRIQLCIEIDGRMLMNAF